jgi:single-strand DNA-binding protein
VAVRSLNKAQLIGNLTRDPELRYTPQGTAVCTFGLATNRQWTTETGEKREEADFHRIVAWNKLAELCAQLLTKGRKVYIEGRLQTRNWTAQDGTQRQTTEIVASDMILLDSRRPLSGEEIGSSPGEVTESEDVLSTLEEPAEVSGAKGAKKTSAKSKSPDDKAEKSQSEGKSGDIPF